MPAAALVATRAGTPASVSAPLEHRLGGGRVVELEDEHGGVAGDPERAQPPAQLVGVDAAAERIGEQVAGEPALGLAHDPPAHQLEADDHRRLARAEALELAEAPSSATTASHAAGSPAPRPGTGTASARPARLGSSEA